MKKMSLVMALVLVIGTATVVRGAPGDEVSSSQYTITKVKATDNKKAGFIFFSRSNKPINVIVTNSGTEKTIRVDANGVKEIHDGTFARAEEA